MRIWKLQKIFLLTNNGLIIKNSEDSLYKKMKYMIKNRNKATSMGKKNYKIFLNSKLNSKNSAKFFISKI